MSTANLSWAAHLIVNGQWGQFWFLLKFRLYRWFYYPIWRYCGNYAITDASTIRVSLQTQHPVALESPDHLAPEHSGTSHDNSTNPAFVLKVCERIESMRPTTLHSLLDLGCSGGQLVADFLRARWCAVGLEGSDYSQNFGRANWPKLGGKNLFTCDITKPFLVYNETHREQMRFDVITAWDVIEHIDQKDLPWLFANIAAHLKPGGYFIASTASCPARAGDVEYHLTQWTNAQWRNYISTHCKWLVPTSLGLKTFDHVKLTYREESLLVYVRA